MVDRKAERRIEPEWQDYFAVSETGDTSFLNSSISKEAVREFCRGCDFLQENNICRRVGSNNQARYANRGCCSWAQINGESGKKTRNGFTPFNARVGDE